MALSSMTGFARGHGVSCAYSWAWELKSVNAKGFDLRLRLPPGWDAVEGPARNWRSTGARARHGARHAHGRTAGASRPACASTSPCSRPCSRPSRASLGAWTPRAPRLDGILSLKGVIEVIDEDEREEDRRAAEAAVIAGFRATVAELAAMRRHEGEALGQVLTQRVREIAALAERAEAAPGAPPRGDQGTHRRAGGDAARCVRPLRSRSAASGGDPDRQQSRYPRGARPARRPTSRRSSA